MFLNSAEFLFSAFTWTALHCLKGRSQCDPRVTTDDGCGMAAMDVQILALCWWKLPAKLSAGGTPRWDGTDILRNGAISEAGYRQAGTHDLAMASSCFEQKRSHINIMLRSIAMLTRKGLWFWNNVLSTSVEGTKSMDDVWLPKKILWIVAVRGQRELGT